MPGPVFLEGDRVTLHAIDEDDLPFLQDTIVDPDVRRSLGNRSPFTEHQEREWYEGDASDDGAVPLLACIREDGAYTRVGSISIGPTDDPSGEAEIGIAVAEPYWGNGYGTEAARLITDYGFRELRCHRIVAKLFDGNVASRRVWEKLGYTHEGVHREKHYLDGEYLDVHCFSVLEHEWL